jgi:hypothetical protein
MSTRTIPWSKAEEVARQREGLPDVPVGKIVVFDAKESPRAFFEDMGFKHLGVYDPRDPPSRYWGAVLDRAAGGKWILGEIFMSADFQAVYRLAESYAREHGYEIEIVTDGLLSGRGGVLPNRGRR